MATSTSNTGTPFDINVNTFTASKTIFGPATRAYNVIAAKATWGVASTSIVLDVTKETGTTAPAGGTSILTATVDTSTTANTAATLALVAATTLAAGDRLSAKCSGTVGSLANLSLDITLQPA